MRTLTVQCDGCGKDQETQRAADEARLRTEKKLGETQRLPRPLVWYQVHDEGAVTRTGMMDMCSLECLTRWSSDPDVRETLPDSGERG